MRRFKRKKPTSTIPKSLIFEGVEYRSKLEILMYQQIKRYKKKTKVEYETVKLKYSVPVRARYYLPDFVCRRPDGSIFYIEIKGYLRSTDRTKTIRVREQNPEIDIRFVFSKDNTINKNSKTKYSDWCKANEFEYSIGSVPKHWFDSNRLYKAVNQRIEPVLRDHQAPAVSSIVAGDGHLRHSKEA